VDSRDEDQRSFEAARIRCPVWAGVGSEDPIMPPAQREAFTAEMQAAGVDWRLVVYGGALHALRQRSVGDDVDDRAGSLAQQVGADEESEGLGIVGHTPVVGVQPSGSVEAEHLAVQ
jgi:dienelactone hydrolase